MMYRPQPPSYYPYPPPNHNNTNNGRECNNKKDDEDYCASSLGAVLGVVLCLVIFLVLLGAMSYPYAMQRPRPAQYMDERWWCYQCTTSPSTGCAARCW
jgi:hypothetical protein